MSEDVDETATLTDYLRILRRRKWQFAVTAIAAPIAAVVLTVGRPAAYSASSKVLVNQQNIADSLFGAQTQYVDPGRAAQTQADLARVLEVARRVVKASHVSGLTPDGLLRMSTVIASPGSDFLTFTVTAPTSTNAIRLADRYADGFVAYRWQLDAAALAHARDVAVRREAQLKHDRLAGTPAFHSVEQQLAALDALQPPSLTVLHNEDRAVKIPPPIVRNGGLGLALGLVLALIVAFLADLLDTRVTSLERIRGALRSLPLLARVPGPPRSLEKHGQLVMMAAPASDEADAFRVLRSNFDLQVAKTGARTVMITSGVAGEGKSTTAGNLALALVRAGRSVILVDFDLRSPCLHQLFGVSERPGLIDVALGDLELEDVLAEVQLPDARRRGYSGRLQLLPMGGTLANPDELRVEFFVERVLKGLEADCVLIDAGPLLPGGDAIALSGFVDAILLVVRLNGIATDALDDLARSLTSLAAIKLGYVVTGAETVPQSKSSSAGPSGRRDVVSERRLKAGRN